MNEHQLAKQRVWAEKRKQRLTAKRCEPRHPLAEVYALAREAYRLHPDGVHGPSHWLRVLRNGREIARRTPGADRAVVEYFALLHDCQRHSEGDDPYHGERAAEYVTDLGARLALTAEQRARLAAACEEHEHGLVSFDLTIGCCWDADRLELSRLMRRPNKDLLSTDAAKRSDVMSGAWLRGTRRIQEKL